MQNAHCLKTQVLQSAVESEEPFSDRGHVDSMQIGLRALEFHYLYLSILLNKRSADKEAKCLELSRLLLHGLAGLNSHPKQPYLPFLWQLVCCPFTPFLILFRSIITSRQGDPQAPDVHLAAMKQLPAHLARLKSMTPLAKKLEVVATVIVEHANSLVHQSTVQSVSTSGQKANADQSGRKDVPDDRITPNEALISSPVLDWDNDLATMFSMEMKAADDELANQFTIYAQNMVLDDYGTFDWLHWDEQLNHHE